MKISAQEVLELLREDPSFREEVRRLVLTDELLNMPRQMASLTTQMQALTAHVDSLTARVDDLTAQMQALTARVDSLTARVDDLTAQMQALTARVDSLTARVDDLTAQMQALTARVDSLTARVDDLTARVDTLTAQMQELVRIQMGMLVDMGEMKGKLAEMEYRQKAHGYFGNIVRRIKLIEPDRLWDILDDALRSGRITSEEERQVRSADMIVHGLRDGSPVWLVVEVSWTVGKEDVERASLRARIWDRCVDEEVLPVAAGSRVAPDAEDVAKVEGVWLVLDGRVYPPGGR